MHVIRPVGTRELKCPDASVFAMMPLPLDCDDCPDSVASAPAIGSFQQSSTRSSRSGRSGTMGGAASVDTAAAVLVRHLVG